MTDPAEAAAIALAATELATQVNAVVRRSLESVRSARTDAAASWKIADQVEKKAEAAIRIAARALEVVATARGLIAGTATIEALERAIERYDQPGTAKPWPERTEGRD